MRRCARNCFLVVAAAALLPACQTEPPTPVLIVGQLPPQRTVIAQVSFGGVEPDLWFSIPISLSQVGELDITVDWTNDDTWMYVYWGNVECDINQLTKGTCQFLIRSETKDPKPRILYTSISTPATYYLYLYNVPRQPALGIGSDNIEAVAFQLGLTVAAPATPSENVVRRGQPTVVRRPGS